MKEAREIDPSIRKFHAALQALRVARAVSIVRQQQSERSIAFQQSVEISSNPDIIDFRDRHPDFVPDADTVVGILPSSTSSRNELKEYLDSIPITLQNHVTLTTGTYANTADQRNTG